jgi:cell division protein FtsL
MLPWGHGIPWGKMDIFKIVKSFLGLQLVVIVFSAGILYQRLNALEAQSTEKIHKLEADVDELKTRYYELSSRVNCYPAPNKVRKQ